MSLNICYSPKTERVYIHALLSYSSSSLQQQPRVLTSNQA